MARPKGALNKRTLSVVNMVQPGEVKYFSLEQFLKNRKRTKMGRRSRKNSSQTEGQEQKQCDGVKDRELTGNSAPAEQSLCHVYSRCSLISGHGRIHSCAGDIDDVLSWGWLACFDNP